MADVSRETIMYDLLHDGASPDDWAAWRQVEAALESTDGLPGITAKMEMGDHDLYVKTAWYRGRIVRIDVTISSRKSNTDDLPKSLGMASAESTRDDLAKRSMESACKLASELLQAGIGIGYIIRDWQDREGWPYGRCKQIGTIDPVTGKRTSVKVKGPQDAVAKLLTKELINWSYRMDHPLLTNVDGIDSLLRAD
jgi:hypothetical protein